MILHNKCLIEYNFIQYFQKKFSLKIELYDSNSYRLGDYIKGGIVISMKDKFLEEHNKYEDYEIKGYDLSLNLRAQEKISSVSEKELHESILTQSMIHDEAFKFPQKKISHSPAEVLQPFCISLNPCMSSSIHVQIKNLLFQLEWSLLASMNVHIKNKKTNSLKKIKIVNIQSKSLSLFVRNNLNINSPKEIKCECNFEQKKLFNFLEQGKIKGKVEIPSNIYKSGEKVNGICSIENLKLIKYKFSGLLNIFLVMKVFEVKRRTERIVVLDKCTKKIEELQDFSTNFSLDLPDTSENYARTFRGKVLEVTFSVRVSITNLKEKESFLDKLTNLVFYENSHFSSKFHDVPIRVLPDYKTENLNYFPMNTSGTSKNEIDYPFLNSFTYFSSKITNLDILGLSKNDKKVIENLGGISIIHKFGRMKDLNKVEEKKKISTNINGILKSFALTKKKMGKKI